LGGTVQMIAAAQFASKAAKREDGARW
jgi:hypothetical protein